MNSLTNRPLKLLLALFLFVRTIHAAQTDINTPGEASKDKENWQGELRAGIAKISITPAHPKKPVHDNVNARVLVLEISGKRLAFVSVDLGVYTSEHLVATCKEKFGLSQVLLSSSHTHSDPGSDFKDFYAEQIVQAVGTAVNNMFPARICAGHRSFPQ